MRRLEGAILSAQENWKDLVLFSEDNPTVSDMQMLVLSSKQSVRGVMRKVAAIRYCLLDRHDIEEVIGMGQELTLSQYQEHFSSQKEPRRNVTIGVRESQRDLLVTAFERIREAIGSKDKPASAEMLADFLITHLDGLSETQIRNEAQGVG